MKELYRLRTEFVVIGLTGKSGAGCSEAAQILATKEFKKVIDIEPKKESIDVNEIKHKICYDFLNWKDNWKPFTVLSYAKILIVHLLFEALEEDDCFSELHTILTLFNEEDKPKRFTKIEISTILDEFRQMGISQLKDFKKYSVEYDDIKPFLQRVKAEKKIDELFFYAGNFIEICRRENYHKTSLLLHDLANNLRSQGCVKLCSTCDDVLENIYTVAETINYLIKLNKSSVNSENRVVIDSLKNSLELNYFKERYGGFYNVAINRVDKERIEHKKHNIASYVSGNEKIEQLSQLNEDLSSTEYKGSEVNSGVFTSPDIENCIQKSDYHIFYTKKECDDDKKNMEIYGYPLSQLKMEPQIVKLISLIYQPGIITPTGVERTMQIAFNAKYNSGCISRQVGAVVTDKNMSVKAVGWNDVPANQIPCNLRSANDLIEGINVNHFSEFEKGESKSTYKSTKNFKEELKDLSIDYDKLEGRNCSFCFKSCHNAFELKENQVHTRSLHAEENAMLQITKYGGQGVKEGCLFTTASPCELCSKKAFQLGIEKIYYIDPYPGISGSHILKSGKSQTDNPTLIMFQGAVGRGFHKLYEPLMAYKDELNIRAAVHPEISNKQKLVDALTDDSMLKEKILELIENHGK